MNAANLVERPQRGVCRITERGRETLQNHPDIINNTVLKQDPEFLDFLKPKDSKLDTPQESSSILTPEDMITEGRDLFHAALSDDLLQRVMACSPQFFERLILDLLSGMGYGEPVRKSIALKRLDSDYFEDE